MLENIRLSFRGIWSHKMRSFLTMLGIIIGIAAIIAIVSTIQGTNEQIEKNLIGSGSNNVKVTLQKDGYDMDLSYDSAPAGVTEVSAATLDSIKELDHVENAALYRTRQAYNAVYYLNTALSGGNITGVDDGYFDTASYVVMKGRGFSKNDYAKARRVALIDESVESSLFSGESALGKTVEIQGYPFTVVGVVTEKDSYDLVINSMDDYYMYAYDDSQGNVFVPSGTWPVIFGYDEPQNLLLKADSTDTMATVGKAAEEILNSNLNVTDGSDVTYKAQDLQEQAKQIQQLSQSTNMMLIWIAGISLLVGGIGVMNIMLVSVTERTREIGLKKAIGARKNRILAQFLTEAAVLTSLGGIIGTITGIALAEIIGKISNVPIAISIPAVILAIAFSTIIGVVFGLLPAVKAANLDPIVALRHE